MANIVIYGQPFGSSFRPHWMLHELGLAYETKKLDMQNGEHRKPEYLAINPAGQVPAMVYDGFVVTESAAIVHYLAEKHDPSFFGPMTPESHATLLRWELFVMLNLNKPFTALAGKNWGKPVSPEEEVKINDEIAKSLTVLEGWLSKNTYLVGDTFTVADIVARATFNYAEMVQYDLSAYPSVVAWMKRCADRPAYQKASGK